MRLATWLALATVCYGFGYCVQSSFASAQAELQVQRLDLDGGQLDLSDEQRPLDWVKWGYPVPDDRSPRTPSALRSQADQTSRKAGSELIGALEAHVPPRDTDAPNAYFAYTGEGVAEFDWHDGFPLTMPSAGAATGGLALLSTAELDNWEYGFKLEVPASSSLRELRVYIDCSQSERAAGFVSVELKDSAAGIPLRKVYVCSTEGQQLTAAQIRFSGTPDDRKPYLLVTVATGDDSLTRGAIILSAAQLWEHGEVTVAPLPIDGLPESPFVCSACPRPALGAHETHAWSCVLLAAAGVGLRVRRPRRLTRPTPERPRSA